MAALERALAKSPAGRFDRVAAYGAALTSHEAAGADLSIVVLPFTNLSPDPDNAYFADGLTDEVITDLSKVRALRVISRSSAFQLRGTTKDTRTIARELNVRYLLEGSVRRAGNALRITAQLIDSATNGHLWAEKYSGTTDDISDLQEKLSRSIVDALRIALTPAEVRALAPRPITDPIAFECYQRAKAGIRHGSLQGLEQAEAMVERGLVLVRESAVLRATAAWIQFSFHSFGFDGAQAHAVTAFILLNHIRLREALDHARRAVALSPSDGESRFVLAACCGFLGRADAREHAQQAVALDPLTPMNWFAKSFLRLTEGRFEEAVADIGEALRLDPTSPIMGMFAAITHGYAGNRAMALDLVKADADQGAIQGVGRLFRLALTHDSDGFRAALTPDLFAYLRSDCHWSWYVAGFWAILGDHDQAIDWLTNAVDRGFVHYPLFARIDPLLAPVRSEPKFQALMERVKREWEAAAQF